MSETVDGAGAQDKALSSLSLIDQNAQQWGRTPKETDITHLARCVPEALRRDGYTDCSLLKLTELSPRLLQLLDLVLQEEHGHCERQQRQKLQLGRHHDSEQPHQIIQGGIWSVHAQRRRH